jgi:RIO kinase 1
MPTVFFVYAWPHMDPLDLLIEDGIIDLMLTRLKSGKEADVFLVDRGSEVLVAKVYKNKAHRSFKNNAEYKEGRKVRNTRTQRAMKSRSKFGKEASEDEWKNTEAATLNRLYSSGVRVPKPVMFYEGVLLMELVLGADGVPAPRLIEAPYDAPKAREHYLDLRAQMIRMLSGDLIHGDLSAYNILDAADGPTIIDFPQIVSAAHTNRAADFFLRDFNNVLDFLTKANASLESFRDDGRKIWQAYASRRMSPDFVPSASRPSSPKRHRSKSRDQTRTQAEPQKRGGRSEAPRRGGRSETPKRGALAEAPKRGGRSEAPKRGALAEAPKRGALAEAPRRGGRAEAPKRGAQTVIHKRNTRTEAQGRQNSPPGTAATAKPDAPKPARSTRRRRSRAGGGRTQGSATSTTASPKRPSNQDED